MSRKSLRPWAWQVRMFDMSVIIVTYNRAAFLPQALRSILGQTMDGNFEVVVVDNNSTDATKAVVEGLAQEYGGRLRYLFERRQGKSYALNTGVQESRGWFVAFTDDDAVAEPDWLKNLMDCFENYDCDGVGGRVLPEYPAGTPPWVMANARTLVGPIVYYDYGSTVRKYTRNIYEFVGANMAFKRSVLDEAGAFRTDLGPGQALMGEDTEMVRRLFKAGRKLYYCGPAVVWHPVDPKRMGLRYIARWNMALGRYRGTLEKKSLPPGLRYIFGFPAYLVRVMAQQAASLCGHAFDRSRFLEIWTELFINVGRMQQLKRKGVDHEPLFERDHLYV